MYDIYVKVCKNMQDGATKFLNIQQWMPEYAKVYNLNC